MFPEVFDAGTIGVIKQRMAEIVDEVDLGKDRATEIAVFSTENSNRQLRDDYFLDSAWQVKPFFESDAVDASGKLLVDKAVAFNKMGHNMHELDPVFEAFSFSRVMRTLLFKAMSFQAPLIVQSMYIFKVNLSFKGFRTRALAVLSSPTRTTLI